jgi:TAG lipase/lysophosphatidylethanolamine acyltransferase
MSKDEHGNVVPWPLAEGVDFKPHTHAAYLDRQSPLHRMGELFNVNHFIVSQARPYLAPFLRSDLHHPDPKQDGRWKLSKPILRIFVLEVQHRLQQMDQLGLLPLSIRRFLLDESIPGPSLTLVPELTPSDFFKLLENPTKEAIDYWILRGERSVWPAVTALKIRCAIEYELDMGYQLVRRRKSMNGSGGSRRRGSRGSVHSAHGGEGENSGTMSRRARAASLGGGSGV